MTIPTKKMSFRFYNIYYIKYVYILPMLMKMHIHYMYLQIDYFRYRSLYFCIHCYTLL